MWLASSGLSVPRPQLVAGARATIAAFWSLTCLTTSIVGLSEIAAITDYQLARSALETATGNYLHYRNITLTDLAAGTYKKLLVKDERLVGGLLRLLDRFDLSGDACMTGPELAIVADRTANRDHR